MHIDMRSQCKVPVKNSPKNSEILTSDAFASKPKSLEKWGYWPQINCHLAILQVWHDTITALSSFLAPEPGIWLDLRVTRLFFPLFSPSPDCQTSLAAVGHAVSDTMSCNSIDISLFIIIGICDRQVIYQLSSVSQRREI